MSNVDIMIQITPIYIVWKITLFTSNFNNSLKISLTSCVDTGEEYNIIYNMYDMFYLLYG